MARKFVINARGTGGYVLDFWGGIHRFSTGSNPQPPVATQYAYWKGWDIARSFVLNPAATGGYTLDGWGGVHPFAVGNNPLPPTIPKFPYWPGQDDMAKDFVVTNWAGTAPSGYVLDKNGGISYFGP